VAVHDLNTTAARSGRLLERECPIRRSRIGGRPHRGACALRSEVGRCRPGHPGGGGGDGGASRV